MFVFSVENKQKEDW